MKFTSTEGSAYEVAIGATAEDAEKQNLAVVEYNYSTIPPTPIYGRYKDAPKGSPLGVTVDDTGGTKVVGAGGPGGGAPASAADKGSLLNMNDPVAHGTADETVHADNADPRVLDAKAEEDLLREGAVDAQAPKAKK